MRTTIDKAGRIVVPKHVRDALGLTPGRSVDMTFTDGRIEIDVVPIDFDVDETAGLPRLVAPDDMPELDAEQVRDTVEATRR